MAAEKIKTIFYLSFLILVFSALFFSAHFYAHDNCIYRFVDVFPSLRTLRGVSGFPAALAVTGLIVIFLSFGFALFICLSPVIFKFAAILKLTRGRRGALVFVLSGFAFPYLVLSTHIYGRQSTLAGAFFASISSSRTSLAFWASGVFIILLLYFVGLVAALVTIFSGKDLSGRFYGG
jgi:hypothetical protein